MSFDQAKANETVERIAADLRAAGVRPGGLLMVHSSLRSLGGGVGEPEIVVRGILHAIGPAGTLLMPALSYELVTPSQPIFDICRTPSNVGAIPEHFRRRPGTRRSMHPTHSVCGLGPLADALLDQHYLDSTPCGPNSPFHLLPNYDGQILMLGCGLRPNTSMHAIEELVEPPYLFGAPLAYRLISAEGREREKVYRQHGFAGWIQRYDRVGRLMAEPGLRTAPVLAAKVHLLEATIFWEVVSTTLRANPLHFVDRAEG